jgi:ssDNA-binding Zn-finger/Zn-ribbon topoisomerase 1
MKKYMNENGFYGPDNFTEKEIEIAKQNGVHIEKRYSRTINESYNANICNHCKTFIGKNFLLKYFNKDKINEIIEYECTYCKEREKEIERDRIETEKELAKVLDELNVEVGFELCPECGGTLRVRNGENGYFWGCENYPECRYIKDIK